MSRARVKLTDNPTLFLARRPSVLGDNSHVTATSVPVRYIGRVTQNSTVTTDAGGDLILAVQNLLDDIAVKMENSCDRCVYFAPFWLPAY